jgi:hypothetical protein
MSDIPTAVITGFVSAFTMFVAVVAFTGRQVRDVKSELRADIGRLEEKSDSLRIELKTDIGRLDEKFERLMFELLRHFREGGHPPPPQAA